MTHHQCFIHKKLSQIFNAFYFLQKFFSMKKDISFPLQEFNNNFSLKTYITSFYSNFALFTSSIVELVKAIACKKVLIVIVTP